MKKLTKREQKDEAEKAYEAIRDRAYEAYDAATDPAREALEAKLKEINAQPDDEPEQIITVKGNKYKLVEE